MTTLTQLRAQLFFARSLRHPPDLAVLLDALAADGAMAPTRWGPAPGVHDPFDRAAVLAFASRSTTEDFRLRLHRARPVEVLVECYDGGAALGAVSIELLGAFAPGDAQAHVAAVDRIATCLPLEFGVVDLRFADVPAQLHALSGGGVHVASYIANGPPTVFPRTYFGPRLAAILGAALAASGGVTHALGDDVVALDLVAEPWTSTPQALAAARVRIDRALRLAGILARPAGRARVIPGPRWVAPPGHDAER